jgi:hypothetical protein
MIVKGREVKVNMQRRHLELIASVINSLDPQRFHARAEVAMMFADALRRECSLGVSVDFDVARFVEACVKEKQ